MIPIGQAQGEMGCCHVECTEERVEMMWRAGSSGLKLGAKLNMSYVMVRIQIYTLVAKKGHKYCTHI